MPDPAHVLVVTLGTPADRAALAHALETFPEAAVTLLAVVSPLDERISEGRVLERGDARLEDAIDRADDLRTSVAEPSRVTVQTREGPPAEVVPAYVDRNDVDHVVVPGHDSGEIARHLLGEGIPQLIQERTSAPVTIHE